MAIITTYPSDTTPSDDDKYLVSDSSGVTKLTSGATLKSYVFSGDVDISQATTLTLPDASIKASNIDFTTIRLGRAIQPTTVTFTNAQSAPVAITGLSVTFTLTQAHTVRAILYSKSLYNTATTSYNIVYICSGSVSVANAFAQSNISLPSANYENTNYVVGEIDLAPGVYTFTGAAGRNTGTLNLTGPITLTVDVVA